MYYYDYFEIARQVGEEEYKNVADKNGLSQVLRSFIYLKELN